MNVLRAFPSSCWTYISNTQIYQVFSFFVKAFLPDSSLGCQLSCWNLKNQFFLKSSLPILSNAHIHFNRSFWFTCFENGTRTFTVYVLCFRISSCFVLILDNSCLLFNLGHISNVVFVYLCLKLLRNAFGRERLAETQSLFCSRV